ncbi:MAG: AbgT family transporter [Bacteroidaceae bacterium]|nr:AbgT family transporter [Bacteroidaceae bacterium]
MNKRSTGWLHPAVIYLILLILVIIVSWIGSIMEISRVGGNGELALRSVLGVPGLRWAVRSAATCLGNAPVGNALMLFIAVGAGRGSGLFRALSRLRSLSPKEMTAFYISLVVLIIYVFLIVLGVFTGSHLLLGITGTLKGSPLYDGIMFLLMLAVCLPSLVYGLSTETFRTAQDCVNAFCTMLPEFAHFLVTMLVAAQLIQTLEYTHIDVLLGLTDNAMRIISFLIYWLPLPIILVWCQKSRKEV